MPTISDAVVLAAVAAGTGTGAAIDLKTRRVPNPLTILVASTGIVLAATGVSGVTVAGALGGFAIGFALMMPGHVLGATGAGDVKLFAAVGTLVGPGRILTAFVDTAIAGGVIALVIAIRRRRLRQTIGGTAKLIAGDAAAAQRIESPHVDNRFAYAPAIAIGAVAAALGSW